MPSEPGFYWVLLYDNVGGGGEPTLIQYLPADGPLLCVSIIGSGDPWGVEDVRVWGPRVQPPAALVAQAAALRD